MEDKKVVEPKKEKIPEPLTASSYVEKTTKLLEQEHKEEVESLETQLKTLSKKVRSFENSIHFVRTFLIWS